MRENPWHLRIPTAEHEQWFKNLDQLNELTLEWAHSEGAPALPDIKTDTKMNTPNLATLEEWMDDTTPEDYLGRLEKALWNRQARLLASFLKSGRSNIESTLEHIAWNAGNASARTHWPKLSHEGAKGKVDLKEVLQTFRNTPFSSYPFPEDHAFLIRRVRSSEIQLELKNCPHRLQDPDIKAVADPLCRLHSQWMHGFVSALSPGVNLNHLIQAPRCVQNWTME